MQPPPSLAAWLVDGEMRGGHTIAETIAWQAWCEEYADHLAARRPPVDFAWWWWRLRHRRRR